MTSSAHPTLLAMDILLPLLFLIAPGFVFLLGQSRFSLEPISRPPFLLDPIYTDSLNDSVGPVEALLCTINP